MAICFSLEKIIEKHLDIKNKKIMMVHLEMLSMF